MPLSFPLHFSNVSCSSEIKSIDDFVPCAITIERDEVSDEDFSNLIRDHESVKLRIFCYVNFI